MPRLGLGFFVITCTLKTRCQKVHISTLRTQKIQLCFLAAAQRSAVVTTSILTTGGRVVVTVEEENLILRQLTT